ncbi:MAG: response regulator, partial [Mariprofundaceae bacterium]|nr:response regulator [Mariprofundaceae bacterium]
ALRLGRVSVPENIAMQQDVCAQQLNCLGSRVQIEQAVINLINNARDALGGLAQPEIRVQMKKLVLPDDAAAMAHVPDNLPDGPYACISVRDNGEGIADTKRIFEPFFTTKEPGSGTGLGLAMVYGSVKHHQGVVDVHSKPGEGAGFDIWLPLIEHLPEAANADEAVHLEGKGRLIVVADDEPFILETMVDLLEKFGFSVVGFEDVQQALHYMQEHAEQVALALLDVVMPVMGGVEAAKEMRRLRDDLPMIFATGYDRNKVQDIEFKAMSQCSVLQKPIDVHALCSTIASLLGDGDEPDASVFGHSNNGTKRP